MRKRKLPQYNCTVCGKPIDYKNEGYTFVAPNIEKTIRHNPCDKANSEKEQRTQ